MKLLPKTHVTLLALLTPFAQAALFLRVCETLGLPSSRSPRKIYDALSAPSLCGRVALAIAGAECVYRSWSDLATQGKHTLCKVKVLAPLPAQRIECIQRLVAVLCCTMLDNLRSVFAVFFRSLLSVA